MPFVVGVGGGPCSKKMFFCKSIKERFEKLHCNSNDRSTAPKVVVILSQECFYKNLSKEQMEQVEKTEFNFDHPDAFDTELFLKTLQDIKSNKNVIINEKDLKTHSICNQYEIEPSKVDLILVEGILVLKHECIRNLMDLKIFILNDCESSLCQRVLRDHQDMERSLDTTLSYYHKFAKPSFLDYCLPTKKYADLMLNADNISVATDVVFEHLLDTLDGESSRKDFQNVQNKIYRNATSPYSFNIPMSYS